MRRLLLAMLCMAVADDDDDEEPPPTRPTGLWALPQAQSGPFQYVDYYVMQYRCIIINTPTQELSPEPSKAQFW